MGNPVYSNRQGFEHTLVNTHCSFKSFSSLEERGMKRSGRYVAVGAEHLEANVQINKFL